MILRAFTVVFGAALVLPALGTSRADQSTPGAIAPQSDATAHVDAREPLRPMALKACGQLGSDSADLSRCAEDFLDEATSLGSRPLAAGVEPARIPLHTDLVSFCTKYYTTELEKARERGQTILIFYVDADGQVKAPTVLKSSGWPRLDALTVHCFSDAGRFTPQSINGVPVGSWQRVGYRWAVFRRP